MKLALFDLDNTLLNGDSDVSWTDYLIEIGVLDPVEHHEQNQKFFQDYQNGILDIHAWLRFQLLPLTKYSPDQLFSWRDQFIQKRIKPIIRSKGVDAVEAHRDNGDQLIMITATNEFVTAPIAELFKIDELIAVQVERFDNGWYTGHSKGIPSFKEGKITRLNDWLLSESKQLSDYEEVWFYSDSHNDIPLLSMATHPIVVNPDDRLRQHAIAHNWQIKDFN